MLRNAVIITAKIRDISWILAAETSQLMRYCSGNIGNTLPVSLVRFMLIWVSQVACTLYIKVRRLYICFGLLVCLFFCEQNYWQHFCDRQQSIIFLGWFDLEPDMLGNCIEWKPASHAYKVTKSRYMEKENTWYVYEMYVMWWRCW